MRSLTIFVLMWRWFIGWILTAFNLTYSYDMLYSLHHCALRIDESEVSYVRTYVHTYLRTYVCMYVDMYVHAYLRMDVRVCACVRECVRACMRVCVCTPEKEILIVTGRRLTFETNNTHPHRTTVVHKFCITDRKARLNFVNWYLHRVLAEQIHHTFIC